jgi:hypothetical protein
MAVSSHPDFDRRPRSSTGSTVHARVADYHRRLGVSPTLETLSLWCHTALSGPADAETKREPASTSGQRR